MIFARRILNNPLDCHFAIYGKMVPFHYNVRKLIGNPNPDEPGLYN